VNKKWICKSCGQDSQGCRCDPDFEYSDGMDHDPIDESEWWFDELSGCCIYCGRILIDDMEHGQGHCITAPCWMFASGLIAEGNRWIEQYGWVMDMEETEL